mgnify:CR=1 FL=1
MSFIGLCTLQQEPSKLILCIEKRENKKIDQSQLSTSFNSELSQPGHSYQYGHFVFDVHVVFLFKSVIPNLIINVR